MPSFVIGTKKPSFQFLSYFSQITCIALLATLVHGGGAHNGGDYNSFSYGVNDPHTGDVKDQYETRVGDKVVGKYSLLESDGTKRVVEYSGDGHNGFNAVVKKDPHAIHPAGHGHVGAITNSYAASHPAAAIAPHASALSHYTAGIAPHVGGVAPYAGVGPYASSLGPYGAGVAPYANNIAPYAGHTSYPVAVSPYSTGFGHYAANAAAGINHYAQSVSPYVAGVAPYSPGVAPYVPGLAPYAPGLAPYAPGVAPYSAASPYSGDYLHEPVYNPHAAAIGPYSSAGRLGGLRGLPTSYVKSVSYHAPKSASAYSGYGSPLNYAGADAVARGATWPGAYASGAAWPAAHRGYNDVALGRLGQNAW